MGASAKLVVPLPAAVLTVGMTALMLTLEITIPYHQYSKVLRWLALSLAHLSVRARVDQRRLGRGRAASARPHISGTSAEFAALVAVFGTTVSPYLFFWQASEKVEEDHDHPETGQLSRRPAFVPVAHRRRGWHGISVRDRICDHCSARLNIARDGITNVQTASQAARCSSRSQVTSPVRSSRSASSGSACRRCPSPQARRRTPHQRRWTGTKGCRNDSRRAWVLRRHRVLDARRPRPQLRRNGSHPWPLLPGIINGVSAPPLIALMIVLRRSPKREIAIRRVVTRGVRGRGPWSASPSRSPGCSACCKPIPRVTAHTIVTRPLTRTRRDGHTIGVRGDGEPVAGMNSRSFDVLFLGVRSGSVRHGRYLTAESSSCPRASSSCLWASRCSAGS